VNNNNKNFSYNNYYKALLGYLSYPELLQQVRGLKLHIIKVFFLVIESYQNSFVTHVYMYVCMYVLCMYVCMYVFFLFNLLHVPLLAVILHALFHIYSY